MTVPFGPLPGDPDVEGVNALLDQMLAGLPVSPAARDVSDEAVVLIESTRRIVRLARRSDAAAASYLKTDPPELRWEAILRNAHSSSVFSRPDATMPALSPRQDSIREAPRGSHAQRRAIPAVAILLFLLATLTGGWLMGQWGSGASDNATSQFATAAGEESTPFSTAYSAPDGDISYYAPPICEVVSLNVEADEAPCTNKWFVRPMALPVKSAHYRTNQWS